MPSPTYVPLANVTLGSTASSVTFSSISQSYRDLIVITNGLCTVTGDESVAQYNGDTASNYSFVQMYGTGSSAASNSGNNTFVGAGRCSTSGTSSILHIFDYSATNKHKTSLSRGDNGGTISSAQVGRWANTAAITSVKITALSGVYSAGATFALYGIAS